MENRFVIWNTPKISWNTFASQQEAERAATLACAHADCETVFVLQVLSKVKLAPPPVTIERY